MYLTDSEDLPAEAKLSEHLPPPPPPLACVTGLNIRSVPSQYLCNYVLSTLTPVPQQSIDFWSEHIDFFLSALYYNAKGF